MVFPQRQLQTKNPLMPCPFIGSMGKPGWEATNIKSFKNNTARQFRRAVSAF